MKAASDGPRGDCEDAVGFVVADERILLGSVADEIAVGYPLRLHELKLPLLVRADQEEDAAALGAVIFEHALRQGRSEVRAAPQEFVDVDVDDVALQGIAWIDTTDVRAERALEPLHVVRIAEL